MILDKISYIPSEKEMSVKGMGVYFLIDVELIYNIVLVSGVQQSDSVIYICFFRLFSIIGYYKILNIVPCAIQ